MGRQVMFLKAVPQGTGSRVSSADGVAPGGCQLPSCMQGFGSDAVPLGRPCGVCRHLACPGLLMYGRLLEQDTMGLAVSP